jgi:exodeoxyribonuclease VII large subunit
MDIIDRIKKRYPTHLELFPVTVQGAKAANEIISGIDFFNKHSSVDIIIIARGGGGAEDFLPFNDENVVRKVFDSKTPVISAIGHETDFTLTDFVADIRAATPTAAAEIAVPDIRNLQKELLQQYKSLNFAINTLLNKMLKNLSNMKKLLNFKTLNNSLNYSKKNLEVLKRNLNYFFLNIKKNKILQLESAESRFKSLNIKNVLKRGYSIVRSHNKKNIIKTYKIKEGSLIDIELSDGIVVASINSKI